MNRPYKQSRLRLEKNRAFGLGCRGDSRIARVFFPLCQTLKGERLFVDINPTFENVTLKADGEEPVTHPIISVDKKEHTPTAYPRPYAQISKKPL